ncbi:MAG: long-chain fatty acid--CoA ligase, partial [Scardovia wiggsiae]|nr:long-chain fatty acid--CoA ligase [Scardovia wiggsiae]
LRTGDLAEIDDDGFIYIVGRKKDVIITAGGKNVSPAPMEDIIKTCPIVSQVVVIGDGRPFISALVTLDPDMLKTWLTGQGRDGQVTAETAGSDDAVRSYIQEYVDRANSTVSRAESIRKFIVIPDDFSQDDKTLTPSMKVVRGEVMKKYQDIIDNNIYAPKPSSMPKAPTARIMEAADTVSESTQRSFKQVQEKIDPIWNKARDTLTETVPKYVKLTRDSSKDASASTASAADGDSAEASGSAPQDISETGK